MRPEIQEAINKWQFESFIAEKRNVQIKPNPYLPSEFIVTLTIKERIVFRNGSRNLEKKANFATFSQSINNPVVNPNGDLYRFKHFIARFTSDYFDYRENQLTELIQEEMPDGFQDL